MRRTIAAGQPQCTQMADPARLPAMDCEQFATPGRAVIPQAETIQCQTQHRAKLAVLGAYRGDMGMMMLHRQCRHAVLRGQRFRQPRAEELRMEVVHNECRHYAGFRAEPGGGLLQCRTMLRRV